MKKKKGLNKLLVKFLVWRLKHISNSSFILIVAGLVGLFSGLAAVLLKSVVHLIQNLLEKNQNLLGIDYLHVVYPILGISITVLITQFILKEKLGHGITNILYSISKRSSIVARGKIYSRMITSSITVGFGGSVGLEAPIVVTGSAIGSNIGRLVHLNYKKRTLLIACGTAGAISAIFNSPITGVIFAIEVMLTDVTITMFIPILIASGVGAITSLILLGNDILFSFKLKDVFTASDLPAYILLGVLCGLISLYFTRIIYWVEGSLNKIQRDYKKALVGGGALALLILIFPPLYGEGYAAIKLLLADQESLLFENSILYTFDEHRIFLLLFLLLIIFVKPFATALTIGAGGSGGIFAPSLFLGGVTGYFFSKILALISPTISISSSNSTLIGMCGVMSGVLHAPLTAIFLIAEITGGYDLFIPLMLVSAISFTTIYYFEKHSLYTKKLIEKGDLIHNDKDKQVLSLIALDKMIEKDLYTIGPEEPISSLVELVKKSHRNIFPVVTAESRLVGIITLDDVREIMFDPEKRKEVKIKSLMQQPPAFVSPQEKMQSVMSKFEVTQAWNLPVIEKEEYIGFVSKSSIFNAYRKKLKRQNRE